MSSFSKKRKEITLRVLLNLQTENTHIMSYFLQTFLIYTMVYLYKGNKRSCIWFLDWGRGGDRRSSFFWFQYPTARKQCAYSHFSLHTMCHTFLDVALALGGLQSLPLVSPYPSSICLSKQGPNSSMGAIPGP